MTTTCSNATNTLALDSEQEDLGGGLLKFITTICWGQAKAQERERGIDLHICLC